MDNSKILFTALYESNKLAPRARYCAIVDFTRGADEHRFFLINIREKKIEYSWFTSHGKGSGDLKKATKFSNRSMSLKSSLGRMKAAEPYMSSKFGYALRLDGLEKGINDNVRKRAIVIHPSAYVSRQYMQNNKYPGRSWGCITLEPSDAKDIIDKLKGGSLVYVIGDES